MASEKDHKEKLVARYTNNEASEKELQVLFGMLTSDELDVILESDMDQEIQSIRNATAVRSKTSVWPKIAGIAAAITFIAMGVWFFGIKNQLLENKNTHTVSTHDINPGKNRATLSLGNGKNIILSEEKSGVVIDVSSGLAYNDGTKVDATVDGRSNSGIKKQLAVSTPRGGSYQVILPDGTKAWLNAASTLKFPENFANAEERQVELIGEAYFEVAKNEQQPFIVRSGGQEVVVLGTHFNINSYPSEEKIRTTLLEGSVKISYKSKAYMLKPGFQAEIGSQVDIKPADMELTMAWMNGDFNFKEENIKSIMRKLERWYDIEVVYEGEIGTINYGAEISRKKTLKQVLKVLEETGSVRFKIEGRRVTVMQ